ncbi:MAG: sigma 54-interacting transcriptional regulator, partial [Pyrinomonadaceae bacterium]
THGDRIRLGNACFMFLADKNSDAPFAEARFDDGTLVTNSAIRIFPNEAARQDFPDDLSVLIKLGKAINQIKESEDLQRKVLEIILGFIPAQRGAILITDDDLSESQAVCVMAKGFSDVAPMQISRTVSRQVLQEQVALLSNDLSDANLEKAESLIASRVTSLLCVPLKIGDWKGLIYLDTQDADVSFTETHLEQMTAVSFLVSAALDGAASLARLRQENEYLKDSLQIETNMIGKSPPLKEVFQMISCVAPTDSTVLIAGESGTGKELAAQAIHRNSRRGAKPFVAINCGVLNENLLESDLFGHERGAFTGAVAQKKGKLEIADSGTVFLDEIGELAPALQVKLLRFLQEREFERVGGTKTIRVNVRVIAATNKNLEDEIANGRFRRDLYFRLNVLQITMPPLRQRKSDIPILAQHFVRKYSERCHRKVAGLSNEARKILLAGEWQGNVRELENVIERAVVLGTSSRIQPEDLPKEMVEDAAPKMDSSGDFNQQLKQAKRKIVLTAIQNAQGNYTEAARLLGIHPNNLHRIVRGLGLKNQ